MSSLASNSVFDWHFGVVVAVSILRAGRQAGPIDTAGPACRVLGRSYRPGPALDHRPRPACRSRLQLERIHQIPKSRVGGRGWLFDQRRHS